MGGSELLAIEWLAQRMYSTELANPVVELEH